MARGLTSNMANRVGDKVLYPFFLVDLEFPNDPLNLWNGIGDLQIPSGLGEPSGKTYTGAGDLARIGPIKETQDLKAVSVTLTLSGVPQQIVSDALSVDYQNRTVRIFLGLFDNTGSIVGDPFQIFGGIMDIMNIEDNGDNSTISVNCESRLADLQRTSALTYTKEDQQELVDGLIAEGFLASGTVDKGFDFVPRLQDKDIRWQFEKGLNLETNKQENSQKQGQENSGNQPRRRGGGGGGGPGAGPSGGGGGTPGGPGQGPSGAGGPAGAGPGVG